MTLLLLLFIVINQAPSPTPPVAPLVLDGVNARFVASNTVPFVGESIEITLEARFPNTITIVEWPEINDRWGSFEVEAMGELSRGVDADNMILQQQTYTVRLWRTGDLTTPETFIAYRLPNDDTIYRISVRNVFLSVSSVLETNDLNALTLRPNKSPVGFFVLPWWAIALLLAFAGSGGYLTYRWGQYRQQRLWEARQPKVTSWDAAIGQLNAVSAEDTQALATIEHIMRVYLKARYQVNALEMTSNEILHHLQQDNRLTQGQIKDLERIIVRADLVKFARVVGDQRTNERAASIARRWIEQTIPDYE
jgi:hypothetical protein